MFLSKNNFKENKNLVKKQYYYLEITRQDCEIY